MSRLKTIFSNVLGIPEEQVTDDLSMQAVEAWDSLKHMMLVAALEEEFEIVLDADEIVSCTEMPNVVTVLTAKGVEL